MGKKVRILHYVSLVSHQTDSPDEDSLSKALYMVKGWRRC